MTKKNFQRKNTKIRQINSWVSIIKLKKEFCLYQRTMFSCFIHMGVGEHYGNWNRLNVINFFGEEIIQFIVLTVLRFVLFSCQYHPIPATYYPCYAFIPISLKCLLVTNLAPIHKIVCTSWNENIQFIYLLIYLIFLFILLIYLIFMVYFIYLLVYFIYIILRWVVLVNCPYYSFISTNYHFFCFLTILTIRLNLYIYLLIYFLNMLHI